MHFVTHLLPDRREGVWIEASQEAGLRQGEHLVPRLANVHQAVVGHDAGGDRELEEVCHESMEQSLARVRERHGAQLAHHDPVGLRVVGVGVAAKEPVDEGTNSVV